MNATALKVVEALPLKLDIGCGKNKREGFQGVDRITFPGVDYVFDAALAPWPIESDSVDEVHSSHFVEHLTAVERIVFFNELFRVLKTGAKAMVITPHWSNARAYGDPTHQWPAVTEWMYLYLNKAWREGNAPHTDKAHWPQGYECDFDYLCGSSWNPEHEDIKGKNEAMMRFVTRNFRDAVQDLHSTLTKR